MAAAAMSSLVRHGCGCQLAALHLLERALVHSRVPVAGRTAVRAGALPPGVPGRLVGLLPAGHITVLHSNHTVLGISQLLKGPQAQVPVKHGTSSTAHQMVRVCRCCRLLVRYGHVCLICFQVFASRQLWLLQLLLASVPVDHNWCVKHGRRIWKVHVKNSKVCYSQVVHVSTAPALVAVGIAGVVAGAGVGDGHDNRRLLVEAGAITVQGCTVAILEGHLLALDFLALAAGVVKGKTTAEGKFDEFVMHTHGHNQRLRRTPSPGELLVHDHRTFLIRAAQLIRSTESLATTQTRC